MSFLETWRSASRSVAVLATPCLMTIAFLPTVALGAPATEIEQIIVVAHKVPRSIRNVAANVTVVSKQDITESLSTSTSDVFQYTPGVDAESAGTRFGTESINIRGIGGNRVALVIDGVPLGDQFDIGTFSNATRDFINAGLINRTEVLHGPASTLYGSDAIGGVVAMYTPDPVDFLLNKRQGGELLATWQDGDNSSHVQATIAQGDANLAFLGAASWRQGEEFEPFEAQTKPDQRDFERKSALLKVVANDYLGHSWRLAYIHQQSGNQSDLQSVLGSGRFRSTTRLLGDDEATMDLLSLEYDLQFLDSWFDSSVLRAYRQSSDINQHSLDERGLARTPASIERLFSYQQETSGLELNIQHEFRSAKLDHHFAFGLEYQDKTTEERRDGTLTELQSGFVSKTILGETFPLRDFPLSKTKEVGAYFEYSVSNDYLTAIAALRADSYKLNARPDTVYLEDNPTSDVVSLSDSELSPKLGLIFHLTDRSDIYLQYAHGFRAPPFEDANIGLDIPLFNIRAIPNRDLKSESSNGFDLGFRWANSNARFHLGVFHTDYQDFIETKVRLGLDPVSGRILFQSQNLSEARISGLEAGGRITLPRNFELSGSFYLADGTNQVTGKSLNSVGPEQLVLGAAWASADARRAVRLHGTFTNSWGAREDGDTELFQPGSYAVFDLYYSHTLGDNTVVRAGLKNFTNQKYWSWTDVRSIAGDDPHLNLLTRPGRQASLSFEFGW